MDYPAATFELDAPEEVANWRPLVQWLLAIPHLIIANVLSQLGGVIAVISWFAIVFTGNIPEGLANFQCLVIRYQTRAVTYAGFLREGYPPFEFPMTPADDGHDPAKVGLQVQLTDRNRLTVGLRFLWIIPIALYTFVMVIAAFFVYIAAFFAVLFTGRWPAGMRSFVIGVMRLGVRVQAYGRLLVDDYPPFSLT
ncbi:MAG: hypothetical protein QOH64_2402 [Acidimicrobiaceae bacterium]|jgi:hypothetical protein